jgi:uncharacterized membrane protein
MKLSGQFRKNRKELLILLLCLIIGFALRFYTFDQKSLWLDEIHTFNDSRYDLYDQLKFYKENPSFLHPPLFYLLTHLFYPFPKPERDLRIIPMIFGVLSIPMFYLLSRSFSPHIALPCTLSLTFMAYHISLSQDGRSYSVLMLLGMAGLYFFMKHLQTSKKRYLLLVALFFAFLFHMSYSSIPFIALSQTLWFYRASETDKKPAISSILLLNGLIFLFCVPWLLFLVLHYKGQAIMDPLHTESTGSLGNILYAVFHDWVPHAPLMIASVILCILFPFFSKYRKNAFVLLGLFLMPVGGLYLYCKLLNITHFLTSRYFINFLPLFFISLYLSLHSIEAKFERLKRLMRLKLLFAILLIASNLVILPLYYRSEKQDFRSLVNYLKGQLKEGDKIFVQTVVYIPLILHYFGIYPEGRQYNVPSWKDSEGNFEFRMVSFVHQDKIFPIYHSQSCCTQYVGDGSRLWIVIGAKWTAKEFKKNSPCILKGYFDGSFLNLRKFPTDASLYLFLWDPKSPDEKGIDMPIE